MNAIVVIIVFVTICLNFASMQSDIRTWDTRLRADFSWKTYQQAYQDYKKNFVMSPYSLRRIFSCLQATKVLSPTASLHPELKDILQLPDHGLSAALNHQTYLSQWQRMARVKNLKMATMVVAIGKKGRNSPQFDNITENCAIYSGQLEPSSSELMGQVVNEAMEKISQGSVTDFVTEEDIEEDWKLFAVDSFQFNGLWRYKFQKKFNAVCKFFEDQGKTGLTNFMYLKENLRYGYFPQWDAQAVELQYHNKTTMSCMLMMPINGSVGDLIKSLTHTRFTQIYYKAKKSTVTVRLPQFSMRTAASAKHVLQRIGLEMPFEQNVFQVDQGGPKVPLGNIIQRVELDMIYRGQNNASHFPNQQSDKKFTANRPFVFVIFDRLDLVPVLVGQYLTTPDNGPSKMENKQYCDNP